MKFTVILSILFDLLSNQKLTANSLAEKYGLSPRTIYRYVEILSAHIPVRIQRGRNGGVWLSDNYKLPVGYMTAEEYESALEALTFAYAHCPEERFLQAQKKLNAQFKTETRTLSFSGELGNVLLDSGAFADTRSFLEKLHILDESVKKHLLLDVEYVEETGEHISQHIEPHVLVFRQGHWYTYAFGHTERKFKLFRVGGISSLWKTGAIFRRRPFSHEDIPLECNREQNFVNVRLEIKKEALPGVQNWLGVENIRSLKGGWYADVRLPNDETLVAKLLQFGANVKVLEPLSLQEKIVQTAKEIHQLYS